jgi:hypothetical protein
MSWFGSASYAEPMPGGKESHQHSTLGHQAVKRMTVHDEELMFYAKGLGKSDVGGIFRDIAGIMVAVYPDDLSAIRFLFELTEHCTVGRREDQLWLVQDIAVQNEASVRWQSGHEAREGLILAVWGTEMQVTHNGKMHDMYPFLEAEESFIQTDRRFCYGLKAANSKELQQSAELPITLKVQDLQPDLQRRGLCRLQ